MIAIVSIAAFAVATAVLWLLLRSPVRGRLVAVPSDERWHDQPTPLFGGVGIFAGFLAGVALALATGAVEWSGELGGILAGVAIVFVVGLVDDLWHLSPVAKLGAQIVAAVVVLASGLNVEVVGNDVLAWAIGLLWLVGITNAFNLLDNMDGLAATLAVVSCAYFAIDAVTEHENDTVLVLALALGLACTAFLPFNLRPRRGAVVFMGDSGSLVIGFALASLALAASWTVAGTTVATILLPLLVLAIPILDTTLVTIARLVEKRPITQGGRDHTSHRLVYYGLSETKAVLLLAIVASAIGATALAYNVLDNGRLTAIGVLVTFVLLVQFGSFLSDLEERSRRGVEGPEPSLWRALVFEPRRLVEVFADFVLICASFLAAYLLVVGGMGTENERSVYLSALPILLGARYVFFVALGVYRRVWRYATARDVVPIVVACFASALAAYLILVALRPIGSFPAVADLRHRRLPVHGARRSVATCAAPAPRDARAAWRSQACARRGRGSRRSRPRARAARERRCARGRLPRRQPARAATADPRDQRPRQPRRGRARDRVLARRRGAREHPRGTARAARARLAGRGESADSLPDGATTRRADRTGTGRGRAHVSANEQTGGQPRPDFFARFQSAVPILVVYFGLAALYAWQASRRPVPTIFTDELELTQLARAIAETGEPARRGVPYEGFASLVAYALAPVWWLSSATASWAAAKLILVLAMTATVFPAYGLARMVVPKWYALAAAGASVAVPALAYSPFLVEEPLAYPVSTLTLWLIARSLERPSKGRLAAAFGMCVVAFFTRTQLAILVAVLVLGLLWLAWQSEAARRWRSEWTTWDWVGAVTIALGVVFAVMAAIGQASEAWRNTMLLYKDRIFEHATWALGALAIGVGVLPVLLGVAALARPGSETRDPRTRAFVTTSVAALVVFVMYAGIKGAYNSTVFSTLVVERNLIYLCPILFISTALAFARGVGRGWAVAGATIVTLWVITDRPAPPRPVPVLRGARPRDRDLLQS